MLVIRQRMIYRGDIQENRNFLYVFGDNLDREGMGGQAAEMRGEPNSFGVATKRSISHSFPQDYFFDNQPGVIPILEGEFKRLEDVLMTFERRMGEWYLRYHYDGVIVPSDGLGTGLSKMPEYAPKALQYIEERIERLREL